MPGIYDLEVDTTKATPAECAEHDSRALKQGMPRPSAFERLAATS